MSSHQSVSLGQVFHDVAYKAKNRADLVAGIDEFLDQVTVLPPGEWDPSIRIEPPKNVPSQVGAAAEGGVRGPGRMADGWGCCSGSQIHQVPVWHSHTARAEAERASGYKYIALSSWCFHRKKGRCQELSMRVLLTASRRNTVVLSWSGQEGVSFLFICFPLKCEHAPPFWLFFWG